MQPSIIPKSHSEELSFYCACQHYDINTQGESAICNLNGTCETTVACYSYAENGDAYVKFSVNVYLFFLI